MRRASRLLYYALPPEKRRLFVESCEVEVQAASGRLYRIRPLAMTDIYRRRFGKLCQEARACLQLTVPAPPFDRMLAEYLLIRNDEARYLKTANVSLVPNHLFLNLFVAAAVICTIVSLIAAIVDLWK